MSGTAPERVAVGRIVFRLDAYPDAVFPQLDVRRDRDAAGGAPGVSMSIAIASHLPGNSAASAAVEIGGVRYDKRESIPQTRVVAVSLSFFTFGASLLQGRPSAATARECPLL